MCSNTFSAHFNSILKANITNKLFSTSNIYIFSNKTQTLYKDQDIMIELPSYLNYLSYQNINSFRYLIKLVYFKVKLQTFLSLRKV